MVFFFAGLGSWDQYVEISEKYMRPFDIENLVGDASKAKKELGWTPKTKYHDLV